jgi:F0F1-type ATP synthase membrane subunit b/b'
MKKWLPLPFMLLAPAAWLAASTGGGAAHAIDWFGVLARVFNSTVLFGGLILLLRKPLIQMLSQKSAAVQADIVEREKELAAAEQRLRDIGERLSRVADEVERIQGGAEAAGRDELARLQEVGRQEAERIIALSEEEIRQRVDAAVRAVKGHIADLAIERFRGDFEKSLDAATQQKIVERNIDSCGGLDEGK